ncbi:MAG: dihydrodipicolinate synthase family protein [Oscillospiraceae bacterium]|nr:dihydrodipicolinate synthase family protein [Oscillospiraceae bacterium]
MSRQEKIIEILKAGTVIPATPLALHSDRSFNPDGQRTLYRYYLDAGVGGLAVGVHTTQFEIRKPEIGLFEPVLRLAAEETDAFEKRTGKTIVKCAGICGPTEQAVKEAKLAKSLGFDAALLSPGGLPSYTEDDFIKRTEAVAAILPVIGFYLQPSVGGRLFTYDYWRRLCEIDGVIAIKCASFNRYQTLDVARAAAMSSRSDKIALFTGNDDNIVIDLLTTYKFEENGKTYTAHFVGGLLGHWCVWTNTVCRMFEMLREFSKQDYIPRNLLTLAEQVTDANSAFFDSANGFAGCIAGVHEVLRRQGIMEGIWCLNPKETLSKGQSEEIDRVYRMYPDLNDDEFVRENILKWK